MEDDIDVLKHLLARAILEFEDVKSKYKEYFEKFKKEESKRKKVDAQFKQLKQAIYRRKQISEGLEQQLKKLTEENQEIRKQNNFAPNTTIISASSPGGTKGELEVLRALKDAVNEELRKTKNELNIVKEELKQEKSAHQTTMKRLNTGVQQIKQLNRVSVLAINEFQDLKKKFEIESSCRKKAEDVATELVVKNELDERKSRIINVEEETQLKKFMEEIEAINAKAEKERKESADRIKDLEEQLESCTQNDENMKEMEEKLSLVMDNLELAQKQLQEAEERVSNAEKESNLSTKSERKKKIGGGVPLQEDDPIVTAMADMIQRIKMGVKLRPIENGKQETVDKKEDGAIGELAGLLTTLKQGRAENEDAGGEAVVPEFARFKLKKTSSVKSADSLDDKTGPTNELKRKLEKQKSVADGIAILEEEKEKEKEAEHENSSGNVEKKADNSKTSNGGSPSTTQEPECSDGSGQQNKLVEKPSPEESDVPEKADNNIIETPSEGEPKTKEKEESNSGADGVYDVVAPASPDAETPGVAAGGEYMEVGQLS